MAIKFVLIAACVAVLVSLAYCYPALEEKDPEVMCRLPPVRGLCRALIPRWTYDVGQGKCVEFKFGGCAGNANNFPSEQACIKACAGIR